MTRKFQLLFKKRKKPVTFKKHSMAMARFAGEEGLSLVQLASAVVISNMCSYHLSSAVFR